MTLHGVDGCRGGWIRATLMRECAVSGARLEFSYHADFAECLPFGADGVVAVDMPIGLLDAARRGGRDCDIAARRLLGRPRSASVFSPPARPALAARTYAEAVARNGGGMTIQAYHLLGKIREVDDAVAPASASSVFEAHPELAFMRLAAEPIVAPKKRPAGRERRRALIERAIGDELDLAGERRRLGSGAVASDDLVDAGVLALTAERIAGGDARRLGSNARDARGLEMAIHY